MNWHRREEDSGTSIVDVTDPRKPRYLAHIPGEPGQAETGGAQMARVCSGKDLPKADKSKFYLLRTFGNLAHEVWDVTLPEKPARIVVVVDKLKGTHKSWWECDSGIAYLVSGLPDWRTRRMTQVFDLSDPARPLLIRNFGLPGQQPGGTEPAPTELHGPISTGPKGPTTSEGVQLALEVSASPVLAEDAKTRLLAEIMNHESTHGRCTRTFIKKILKQTRLGQ